MTTRPTLIVVTSREEGMPFGEVFPVIGWTGFDQAVVNNHREECLLVLDPADFEAVEPRFRLDGTVYMNRQRSK